MSVASCAQHLCPSREEAVIALCFNAILGNGRPKTGPTGSGIKLGVRTEQVFPAAHAPVCAFALGVVVLPCKSPLRSLFSGNVELLRCQDSSPFFFAFYNPVRHVQLSGCFSFAGLRGQDN